MSLKVQPESPNEKKRKSIDEILRSCRLCGAGGGDSYKMPIIQNAIDLDNTDVALCQKIKECLQIEVEIDDKMPPLICELCINKINDFHLFRLLCKETNNQTRMKLGLPPEHYFLSPVLESAMSVTLLLCDHDSSDSEPIVSESTRTPNKIRLQPKSKQIDMEENPLIKEPPHKDSRPLLEQGSDKNRMLNGRAGRQLRPITKKSITEDTEENTSIDIWAKEIDVPLELPPVNSEHNSVKTTRKKQANICIPITKHRSYNESNTEMDTESIATLREDRTNITIRSRDKGVATKNNNSDKKLNCAFCIYSTNNNSKLKIHEKVHTGEKPYKCNKCEFRTTINSNLKIHKRIHTGEKPYRCSVCDYSCTQYNNLIRHKRTHTGEKPYRCNVCDYSCNHSSNLINHKRTHTGEKPYRCSACDYSCTQKINLTKHKRTHTGEKPYRCNVCEFRCTQLGSLKIHVRRHTDEKPYRCSVCDYSCTKYSNLIRHKRTHTGEKPYRCNICDYRCTKSSYLINHKRTHTGE